MQYFQEADRIFLSLTEQEVLGQEIKAFTI